MGAISVDVQDLIVGNIRSRRNRFVPGPIRKLGGTVWVSWGMSTSHGSSPIHQILGPPQITKGLSSLVPNFLEELVSDLLPLNPGRVLGDPGPRSLGQLDVGIA